jgi:hypothetical protein
MLQFQMLGMQEPLQQVSMEVVELVVLRQVEVVPWPEEQLGRA